MLVQISGFLSVACKFYSLSQKKVVGLENIQIKLVKNMEGLLYKKATTR